MKAAILVALFPALSLASEVTLTAVCNPGPSFDNSVTASVIDHRLLNRIEKMEERVISSSDRGGTCSLSFCVDGNCTTGDGVLESSLDGTLEMWVRLARIALL